MVEAARPQPAGAEGAADVDIPSPGEQVSAELADVYRPRARTQQQEGIGAAHGGNFMCL